MVSLSSAARSAYDLAFQISPLILTGGIAQNASGQALPVIALTGQLASFVLGALSGGLSLDDAYARFVVLPGATVVNNAVGTYPFANQNVAANAIVTQPLTVSLQMIAPVKGTAGYYTKLAVFTSLQQSFATHNANGGTYSVATPSYIYTNCLMTGMTDITPSSTNAQQQTTWQLDFVQPLVSQQQAGSALSAMMHKMGVGSPTSGAWSGETAAGVQGAVSGVPGALASVTQALSQPITSALF